MENMEDTGGYGYSKHGASNQNIMAFRGSDLEVIAMEIVGNGGYGTWAMWSGRL